MKVKAEPAGGELWPLFPIPACRRGSKQQEGRGRRQLPFHPMSSARVFFALFLQHIKTSHPASPLSIEVCWFGYLTTLVPDCSGMTGKMEYRHAWTMTAREGTVTLRIAI